MAVAQSPK